MNQYNHYNRYNSGYTDDRNGMNQTDRVLSALAYFSIFFLGFIFPAVLWFITNNPQVKRHAGAAFISHCIPVILAVVAFIMGFFIFGFSLINIEGHAIMSFAGMFILLGLFGLISLAVVIWNVYKGIKVLL
ncbi:DUF4870 domain-containing protein [Paenibacillus thermotolerans]|uniref:DUF4870 domain-containing protein n=1 Tax=Paenibacillus thermotolerans TaxID=3027807 RepID=UPI002367EF1C|nr:MULTISPECIES: DUF4870 domain-containing protein [unclassified Paenibacillus]